MVQEKVEIAKNSVGQTLTFTFEDVDMTTYSSRINIWNEDGLIVDQSACTDVLSGDDTVVAYIIEAAATATAGDYLAEITFYTGTTYVEPSKPFRWKVKKSGESLS